MRIASTRFLADVGANFRTRTLLIDPIESMRGLAVLLLLSFHVIGADPNAGLQLDYPHPLRVFADLLIDLRMPLFAFIAGYVYGLRPIRSGEYGSFVTGKFKRLAVPGGIAILVFALIATASGKDGFAVEAGDLWRLFLFPYAHYWFLQAILLIFLVHGIIEILTGHRRAPLLLGLACAAFLLPRFSTSFFSVNSAVQLLPFYLLGLVFLRHRDQIMRHRRALIVICLAAIAAGTIWNLAQLFSEGKLSQDRRDLQSLAVGLGACLLAVLMLPRIAALSWIGPASFTIYLYHVLGTASTRDVLHGLGLTSVPLNYVLGIIGGILLPVGLHVIISQNETLRGPVLGLWRQRPPIQSLAKDCAHSLRASGKRSAQDT